MQLEAIAVAVIAYDILTAVAADHEVVDRIGVGVLEAYSSWHAIHNNILVVGWHE